MPDSTHHITHTEKNLKFLKKFYKDFEHNDWAITVSFYTALHVIESAIHRTKQFEIQGKKLNFDGTDRARQVFIDNGIIKSTDKLSLHNLRGIIIQYSFPKINAHYATLSNMAWSARYFQFAWEQKDAFFATEFYLKEILNWHNGRFHTALDTNFK